MMTTSPLHPLYFCQVNKEYRSCVSNSCGSQRKEHLYRSTKCCHTFCRKCLHTKPKDGFYCDICNTKLIFPTDFTEYEKDDKSMSRSQTKKYLRQLKNINRTHFESTPTYDDYLEKIEMFYEMQRNNQTASEEFKAIVTELHEIVMKYQKYQ